MASQAARTNPASELGRWDLCEANSRLPASLPLHIQNGREDHVIVRGRQEIVALKPLLVALARMTGQEGEADDIPYTPTPMEKSPLLLLQRAGLGDPSVRGFCGATLAFEYQAGMVGTRVFSSSDHTGRSSVIALPESRASVAAKAVRALMEWGAQIVRVAYNQPLQDQQESDIEAILDSTSATSNRVVRHQSSWLWSLSERYVPLYLPLESTFDGTLAGINKRTRANLRYYRRRAERDLGCTFISEPRLSSEEFLAFNRKCMFTVPDAIASRRFCSLASVSKALLCGIQDRDGHWLALVGGRLRKSEIEIDWQMNRSDLPQYSLCTVMRSFLIEHEVGRGSKRLFVDNGTSHAIKHSFQRGRVVELSAKRNSLYTRLMTRFSAQLIPENNLVSQVLRNPQLEWRPGWKL